MMREAPMDHAAYQAKVKRMSFEQLTYIIADCRAVLAANPMGHKAGHYCDEINYCAAELAARAKKQAITKSIPAQINELKRQIRGLELELTSSKIDRIINRS